MEAYHLRDVLTGRMNGRWQPDQVMKYKDLLQIIQYEIQREQLERDTIFINNQTNKKMNITLKLEADPSLIAVLKKLLASGADEDDAPVTKKKKPVVEEGEEEEEEEVTPVKKKKKPVVEEEEEEEEEEETKEEEEEEVDLETISALAKKKVAAGKSAKLKALLTKFKAAKVSDLKEAKYQDFFDQLKVIK